MNGMNGMNGMTGFLDPSSMLPNANGQLFASQPQHQAFNPAQVLGKRPRPDDLNIASPRPPPALSRSQTPQAGYGPGMQQQLHAPNPYQHLQHSDAANGTPSPTLHNRLNTVSPNPAAFGQQQNFSMSPPPDQQNRVGTPQNPNFTSAMGGMNYMPNTTMGQPYGQNFAMQAQQQGQMGAQPVMLSQNLQARQAETQKLYQMRMQAQQRGMGQPPQMNPMNAMNPMIGGTPQRPNQPMPGQPQNPQQKAQMLQGQSEQFIRSVAQLMAQAQRPFNANPVVQGRVVNIYQLWRIVVQGKGSKFVTQQNMWPLVAQNLGFGPEAAHDIKKVYEVSLAIYEHKYWQSVEAKKRQQLQQIGGMVGMGGMNPMGGMTGQPQMSPTRPMMGGPQDLQTQQQQYMQQLQQRIQPPQTPQQQPGQMTPQQANAVLPSANGFSSPQSDANQVRPPGPMGHQRSSLSRQIDNSPVPGQTSSIPPPSPAPPTLTSAPKAVPSVPETNGTIFEKPKVPDQFQPDFMILNESWGGVNEELFKLGRDLLAVKPDVPRVEEMGLIDIRAISKSLESGITSEVRYALDTLLVISNDPRVKLELDKCEDLLFILLDCAEEQIELLADETPEVSDAIDLTPYEEVLRAAKAESHGLQDVHEFGTAEYDLDRAADRLIAIVGLLRNLASVEQNLPKLSSPPAVKLISNTIRLLGTRNMLLRSNINTTDFMKDALNFLSYISHHVELPSKEDAHNILHFLLSFAPSPPPPVTTPLRFTLYNPNLHRYLPTAVDTLAKLLARDEPNRQFFKTIFTSDAQSQMGDPNQTPGVEAYSLLTRTFGLAISVIPDATRRDASPRKVAELRKPTLIHGMLAADVIASICPGPETDVAKAWLQAEDAWCPTLVRLCHRLSNQPPGQAGFSHEEHGFGLVTRRAFAMLKTLVEKTKKLDSSAKPNTQQAGPTDSAEGVSGVEAQEDTAEADGVIHDADEDDDDDDATRDNHWIALLSDIVPPSEFIMGALFMPTIDGQALKQMIQLANVDV